MRRVLTSGAQQTGFKRVANPTLKSTDNSQQ